jgi:hypothetical protein
MSPVPPSSVHERPAATEPTAPDAPRVRALAATASLAALATGPLAGCSSHEHPVARTPAPHSAAASPTPSPTDTTVIPAVPSIVPFVNSVLRERRFALPLEADRAECPLGRASHLGQTCRWHPREAGESGYRFLQVSTILRNGPGAAQDYLNTVTSRYEENPEPVALGDGATAGTAAAPGKPVTIRGRDQSLALSGAMLSVRVHNVNIDITWLGADYTVGSHGAPVHVVGLAREPAVRLDTAVAKAIIKHLR